MMIDTKDIERRIYDRVVRGGDQLLASIAHECVDHIDSLLMENERLRKALEHIANDKPPLGHMAVMIDYHHLKRIAQDALAQKEPMVAGVMDQLIDTVNALAERVERLEVHTHGIYDAEEFHGLSGPMPYRGMGDLPNSTPQG